LRVGNGFDALVIAGAQGDLARMPRVQSTSNRIELAAEARMETSGAVSAHLTPQYFGQSGALYRYTSRSHGDESTRRSRGRRKAGSEHRSEGAPVRTAHASKLLIVRPGALAPDHGYNLPKKARKLPVKLEARARHDRIELQLPPGFIVDEMPDALDINGAYGTYGSSWKATPERIIFQQFLEIQDVLAPASEYPKVREFFEKLSAGQYSPALPTRK
jgi:hypothetical protein